VLVDDHAVTHQAEARAAELVAAAEQQASAVRGEADAYARKVMGLLEDQLTQALTTVRRGLASLAADTSSRGRGQRAG
jgi:cell division septum initiation protein DivIVA